MLGSLKSIQWNVCMHRLDLGLYSHLKELKGLESELRIVPKEISPQPDCSEEGRASNAASCRIVTLAHYQLSYVIQLS